MRSDGAWVGTLPPIAVATPWWQDVALLVHAARAHFGIEVVVLRLLAAELSRPPSGHPIARRLFAEPVSIGVSTGLFVAHI